MKRSDQQAGTTESTNACLVVTPDSSMESCDLGIKLHSIFTPQPLRAVGVWFSPMVSGWAGGWREEVCPACSLETIMCRKLILGRDSG